MKRFKIDEPTVISFSGGRTSGSLLWHVLEANNGLPSNAVICFQNTGKEHEETLRFVKECALRWSVGIVWLEYDLDEEGKPAYKEVDYKTASRNGEPFEKMIRKEKYLPNAVQRLCTKNLKSLVMSKYLRDTGQKEWVNMVGIRADEPRRWASNDGVQYTKKTYANGDPVPVNTIIREEKYAPLRFIGFTKEDRDEFWRGQPFDLQIDSDYSNCDYCYLKGQQHIYSKMQERPGEAEWWAKMEEMNGSTFWKDGMTYRRLMKSAEKQATMDFGLDDRRIPCNCFD